MVQLLNRTQLNLAKVIIVFVSGKKQVHFSFIAFRYGKFNQVGRCNNGMAVDSMDWEMKNQAKPNAKTFNFLGKVNISMIKAAIIKISW